MNRPNDIHTEIEKLRSDKKAMWPLLLVEIMMLALIAVLLFTADIRVVYAAAGLTLAYSLLVIRPARRRYTARITELEAVFGAAGGLDDRSYRLRDTLPRDALERDRLVSTRQWTMEPVCRHSIAGSYAGTQVRICECSFAVSYGDRRGDVSFLNGTYIEAAFHAPLPTEAACISRDIEHISGELPDLSCYGLENVPFNGQKADRLAYAFTGGAPVPAWLEKSFVRLCSEGSAVMLSLHGDRMTVFLLSRFFAAKHRLSDAVSVESLSHCRLPEKDAVLELIGIIQRKADL